MTKKISIPRKTYGLERFEVLLQLTNKQLQTLLNRLDILCDKEYKKIKKHQKCNFKGLDLYEHLEEDIKKLLDPFGRRMIESVMPVQPLTDQERENIRKNIEKNKKNSIQYHTSFEFTCSSCSTLLPSEYVKYTDNGRSIEYACMTTRSIYIDRDDENRKFKNQKKRK